MFGGSWVTTIIVICPFLVVAVITLPMILYRYLRGDFKDKKNDKKSNDNSEVK